jgi:hypothetical protein
MKHKATNSRGNFDRALEATRQKVRALQTSVNDLADSISALRVLGGSQQTAGTEAAAERRVRGRGPRKAARGGGKVATIPKKPAKSTTEKPKAA